MSDSFVNGSAEVAGSGSVYIPGSRQIPTIPIDKYELNVDPNPQIVEKKSNKKLQYIQNVSLKFLRFFIFFEFLFLFS